MNTPGSMTTTPPSALDPHAGMAELGDPHASSLGAPRGWGIVVLVGPRLWWGSLRRVECPGGISQSHPRRRESYMSARRVLAGSAVALLLPASLLLTIETGSATDSAATPASTSVTKKASQKISRWRCSRRSSSRASAPPAPTRPRRAVTATIKPVKVGRKVVLEQLDGTSWKKVGTAKQEKSGRANFSAAGLQERRRPDLPRHRAEVQGPQEGHQHDRRHGRAG